MVHLIGNSLGAHVAGAAGYKIKSKTGKKVSRITGLDPAGPLLNFVSLKGKLDKSDAKFVDAIHTASLLFGSTPSSGNVDFWANGGRGADQQPDCLVPLILGFGRKN